jgi:hypothetical protein
MITKVSQSGWQVTNNLVNAGSQGNTNVGWTTSNGQSGVPNFVGYTAYSLDNDYRLTASGAASGKGAI